MSVHTGRYPLGNGVTSFYTLLREDTTTIAEILRNEGYRTAAFGSSPEYRLYDAIKDSLKPGFEVYTIASSSGALPARNKMPVDEMFTWLSTTGDTPFFLWIPIGTGHWPYGSDTSRTFANASYDGLFSRIPSNFRVYSRIWDNVVYPLSDETLFAWHTDIARDDKRKYEEIQQYFPTTTTTLSDDDRSYITGRYDDGVLETDGIIKKILEELQARKLDSNTIVVIVGTHGEGLVEHGYIGHYDINETISHAPLLFSIPGTKGAHFEKLASGVDVFTTLLSLLAIAHSPRDGVNLFDQNERREVFLTRTPLFETLILDEKGVFDELREKDRTVPIFDTATLTKEWKLIHRSARTELEKYSWWGRLTGTPPKISEYELYNIRLDPEEKINLYNQEAAVAEYLQQRLNTWEDSFQNTLSPAPIRGSQEYF